MLVKIRSFFPRDMSQTVKNAPLPRGLAMLKNPPPQKKILERDAEGDDFQNLTSSSSSTDISLAKFS